MSFIPRSIIPDVRNDVLNGAITARNSAVFFYLDLIEYSFFNYSSIPFLSQWFIR